MCLKCPSPICPVLASEESPGVLWGTWTPEGPNADVCARRSDVGDCRGDCASNGVRSTKAAWSRRCLVCQWPTTPRPSTTSTARGCVIKKVKLPVPIALHHPCRSVPTQARRWFRTSTPGAGRSFAAARNGPKIDLPLVPPPTHGQVATCHRGRYHAESLSTPLLDLLFTSQTGSGGARMQSRPQRRRGPYAPRRNGLPRYLGCALLAGIWYSPELPMRRRFELGLPGAPRSPREVPLIAAGVDGLGCPGLLSGPGLLGSSRNVLLVFEPLPFRKRLFRRWLASPKLLLRTARRCG